MPEDAPEVVQDLIKKLLLKDPSKRLGADDLNKLKAHPFFVGVEFETLYDKRPPLLDKHMRLSMQQQKELKFLPRKQAPSNPLHINTRKTELSAFADRVRSQMSASIIHSPMSSGTVQDL
jgi:serine/threonine protein kinase